MSLSAHNITKHINDSPVLNRVSFTVPDTGITVISGKSGCGKSTMMRILAGVVKPDAGEVILDDRPVFDNPLIKKRINFISDDPYIYPYGSLKKSAGYLKEIYGSFDEKLFNRLKGEYDADDKRLLNIKGEKSINKKKAAFILGLALGADHILFDDPYLGVDDKEKAILNALIKDGISLPGKKVSVILSLRDSEKNAPDPDLVIKL